MRKNAPPALARGGSILHAGGQPAYREPRRASLCPCRGCRVLPAPDHAGLPVRSDRPSSEPCPICAGRGRRTPARLCGAAPPFWPDRPSRVCRKPCGRRRWISPWRCASCSISTGRPPLPSPRPSPSDPAQGRERGAFCRSACSEWRLSPQERAAWVWAVQVGGFPPPPRVAGLRADTPSLRLDPRGGGGRARTHGLPFCVPRSLCRASPAAASLRFGGRVLVWLAVQHHGLGEGLGHDSRPSFPR